MKKTPVKRLALAVALVLLAGLLLPMASMAGGAALDEVTLRLYFPGDKRAATDDVWNYVTELVKDS